MFRRQGIILVMMGMPLLACEILNSFTQGVPPSLKFGKADTPMALPSSSPYTGEWTCSGECYYHSGLANESSNAEAEVGVSVDQNQIFWITLSCPGWFIYKNEFLTEPLLLDELPTPQGIPRFEDKENDVILLWAEARQIYFSVRMKGSNMADHSLYYRDFQGMVQCR